MKTYDEPVLFTPGPTSVPRRVLDAYARPVLHHRTPEFSALLGSMLEKAQWLFATSQPVLPVHTTGRGAMEAIICNLFCRGDEIICLCNGKFGAMFADMGEIHGLTVYRVCTDWERVVDLAELEDAIAAHPNAKAVTMCHNESTTAVTLDIASVSALAKAHGMLTIVDTVSSAGCIQIDFDACGADALVTASQKGLMCTPGMALVVLSEAGRKACETATLPKYYTDFKAILKSTCAARPETPGSTPVSAVYGMLEALTMMQEEGREALFARHARIAGAVRAALRALNLPLFPENVPEECRSNSLTAFTSMEGLPASELKDALKKEYGLSIAGGIGPLKGCVLRIGHMGNCHDREVIMLIACLEGVLQRRGLLPCPGAGLKACLDALSA